MKSFHRIIRWVVVGLMVLGIAGNSQASDKKSITLYEKSQLNDMQLSPGVYKVEAVGSGETGELFFYKGKNVVAKVPFEIQKLNIKVDRSTLGYQEEKGQARRIIEVRFSGQDQVYKIVGKDKLANTKNSSSGG
ncbi:MAG: hypothetical protein U0V70_12550 [Terriglobia bacterium]